jgi:hypothetical protein
MYPSMPRSPNWSLPFVFTPMHATFPAHLILPVLKYTLKIFHIKVVDLNEVCMLSCYVMYKCFIQ